jgi:hypothetical protein
MVIPNSYDKVLYFLATWATVIPNSHYKVLYLLVACQKYEMASVQSFICAEVSRGEFPLPKGAEAFLSYAIAAGKGLVPEMENAARQTLDHLMTFEILREGYNCLRVGLCETLSASGSAAKTALLHALTHSPSPTFRAFEHLGWLS